jgi:hypothetical protein
MLPGLRRLWQRNWSVCRDRHEWQAWCNAEGATIVAYDWADLLAAADEHDRLHHLWPRPPG